MIGVMIAASDRDKKMWKTVPDILRKNFSAVYVDELQSGGDVDAGTLVIYGPEDARKISPTHVAVLFRDADDTDVFVPPGATAVAVVDSSNKKLMERVSATGLPAITCGLSPRDTLTLPSYGVDSAVLGLQRSITCFDGTVAEPQEIPLKKTGPVDRFALMAASSVFLLAGHLERLRHAIF